MNRPLVILDLGSTLVRGPAKGPAYQLADRLHLSDDARRELNTALMTVDFQSPGPVADLVGELSGRGADHEVHSVVEEVWSRQECDARPIPGAGEALARLHDYGVRFAVLSNIWLPYLRAVRRHFGDFFDTHVPAAHQFFSSSQGCRKPSPEIFKRLLAAAGSEPGDAIMLGDTYKTDIAPAIALGLRTLWLLEQPGREKTALTRVVNGQWEAPTLALSSLADLSGDLIESLILRSERPDGAPVLTSSASGE